MQKEELDKLRAEYGDVAIAKIGGREVVFRTPSLETWETFQEKVAKDKSNKSAAVREVCYSTVVNMTVDELHALFEKFPASPAKCADKISDLAGGDIEAEVKKG